MKIFESEKAIDIVFNIVFAVFFLVPLFAYGMSVYAENNNKKYVELSDSVKTAEKEMKMAEEEMFWQAQSLCEKLEIAGGYEYISEQTKSIIAETRIPNLEYYKAAINDMQGTIDPDGDRFDDCDYKMAWKVASKAESEYERLSNKLDSMTYMK